MVIVVGFGSERIGPRGVWRGSGGGRRVVDSVYLGAFTSIHQLQTTHRREYIVLHLLFSLSRIVVMMLIHRRPLPLHFAGCEKKCLFSVKINK